MDKISYQSCFSDCNQELSQEYLLKVLPICVFLNVNSTFTTDFFFLFFFLLPFILFASLKATT